MSGQGDRLLWGRRIPRSGLGAGGERSGNQGESSHREPTRHVEREEMSVHNEARGGNVGGQADPLLQRLVDLLTATTARQPRAEERVGSYTITSYLKLLRATKDMGTQYFDGEPDPMKADEWLEKLEENLETTLCPPEYKKNIAEHFLEKEAKAWWKTTERQLGGADVSWDLFKSEFLRKYFPSEARDRLERQFLTLAQGDRSVREYEAEFTRLRRYVYRGQEDETTMMRYFLNGLKPELGSRLSVVEFQSLNRMIECAADVEDRLDQIKPIGNAGVSHHGKPKSRFSRQQPAATQMSGKGSVQFGNRSKSGAKSGPSGGCFNCGKPGHFARDCRAAKTESRKRDRPVSDHITCFICSEKGHYASSCPNRVAVSGVSVNRPQSEATKATPAMKKKATEARVYSLNVDEPESSNPKKGPVAGM